MTVRWITNPSHVATLGIPSPTPGGRLASECTTVKTLVVQPDTAWSLDSDQASSFPVGWTLFVAGQKAPADSYDISTLNKLIRDHCFEADGLSQLYVRLAFL